MTHEDALRHALTRVVESVAPREQRRADLDWPASVVAAAICIGANGRTPAANDVGRVYVVVVAAILLRGCFLGSRPAA